MTMVLHSIDICTVPIKNIRNMHAVSTNQIADILRFNDRKSSNNFLSFADSFMENNAMKPYINFETYLYNKSKRL